MLQALRESSSALWSSCLIGPAEVSVSPCWACDIGCKETPPQPSVTAKQSVASKQSIWLFTDWFAGPSLLFPLLCQQVFSLSKCLDSHYTRWMSSKHSRTALYPAIHLYPPSLFRDHSYETLLIQEVQPVTVRGHRRSITSPSWYVILFSFSKSKVPGRHQIYFRRMKTSTDT